MIPYGCRYCGETDPTKFRPQYKRTCKVCNLALQKAWRQRRQKYRLQYEREWRANPVRLEKNRQLSRATRWAKQGIDITQEQYDAMLSSQNNRCAACQLPRQEDTSKRNWPVDHNHDTGQIRGILCDDCNKALGHARDSIDILRALASYLEGSSHYSV